MKVYLASDHAGFELKAVLMEHLTVRGVEVEDLGPHTFDPADDYPDYIIPLAKRVSGEAGSRGIAIGGSGEGEAMAANRVKGARAAVYHGGPMDAIRLSREHNDANMLSLGARLMTADEAWEAVVLWLETPFSGDERHARRIGKLDSPQS